MRPSPFPFPYLPSYCRDHCGIDQVALRKVVRSIVRCRKCNKSHVFSDLEPIGIVRMNGEGGEPDYASARCVCSSVVSVAMRAA